MARHKGGRKFIQKATDKMRKKGTLGSYGHHSVAQMKHDKAEGGAVGKKANFALNMHNIRAKKKRGGSKRRSYRR